VTDEINVREATLEDGERVLVWRNHASVVSMSSDPVPIDPARHAVWFPRAIADPLRVILIGEWHGQPIGVVRFDTDDDRAVVSIFLDPARTGKGFGRRLLAAGEAWLRARRPHIQTLHATVLETNARSQRMFEALGYVRASDWYVKHLRTA
jgi:RimJ/RimL family protein N-acetyltransferase